MSVTLAPHVKDVDGLAVRRVLPGPPLTGGRRFVGPFVFFDHMGPATFAAGQALDVRPHPHIGLATVTYLFSGAIEHRDSLGTIRRIEPGAVNWMVAGRGIVHSERTPADLRAGGLRMHGIQTWVALPRSHERTAPSFTHVPAADLPEIVRPGLRMRVVAGDFLGERAPTPVVVPTLYVAVEAEPGARFDIPVSHEERAVYLVEGEATLDGAPLAVGHMVVLDPTAVPTVACATAAKFMLAGGAALDGPRFLWWNFVASERELIEEAKARWIAQSMGRVPGETEFIPLPER